MLSKRNLYPLAALGILPELAQMKDVPDVPFMKAAPIKPQGAPYEMDFPVTPRGVLPRPQVAPQLGMLSQIPEMPAQPKTGLLQSFWDRIHGERQAAPVADYPGNGMGGLMEPAEVRARPNNEPIDRPDYAPIPDGDTAAGRAMDANRPAPAPLAPRDAMDTDVAGGGEGSGAGYAGGAGGQPQPQAGFLNSVLDAFGGAGNAAPFASALGSALDAVRRSPNADVWGSFKSSLQAGKKQEANDNIAKYLKENPNADVDSIANVLISSGDQELALKGIALKAEIQKQKAEAMKPAGKVGKALQDAAMIGKIYGTDSKEYALAQQAVETAASGSGMSLESDGKGGFTLTTGGAGGRGAKSKIVDGVLVTAPTQKTTSDQQEIMGANVGREFLNKYAQQPYVGEGASKRMYEDKWAYRNETDPVKKAAAAERLMTSAVSAALLPDVASFTLTSTGTPYSVSAKEGQMKAITQGWGVGTNFTVNNLPPELQEEARARTNRLVGELNRLRGQLYAQGFPIDTKQQPDIPGGAPAPTYTPNPNAPAPKGSVGRMARDGRVIYTTPTPSGKITVSNGVTSMHINPEAKAEAEAAGFFVALPLKGNG